MWKPLQIYRNSGSLRLQLRTRTAVGRPWQAPSSTTDLRWVRPIVEISTIYWQTRPLRLLLWETTHVSHLHLVGITKAHCKIIVTDFVNEFEAISSEPLVVLTGHCLKLESTSPCNMVTLGSNSLNVKGSPFSHAAIYDTRYSL